MGNSIRVMMGTTTVIIIIIIKTTTTCAPPSLSRGLRRWHVGIKRHTPVTPHPGAHATLAACVHREAHAAVALRVLGLQCGWEKRRAAESGDVIRGVIMRIKRRHGQRNLTCCCPESMSRAGLSPKRSLPVVINEYMALDGVELKSPAKMTAGDCCRLLDSQML